MKKTIFILVVSMLSFFSCTKVEFYTLTPKGYDWADAPSAEPKEQYLAYRYKNYFMLAKNSPNDGLRAIKEVIAVKSVKEKNSGVTYLAYKENNYDANWTVVLEDGSETPLSVEKFE